MNEFLTDILIPLAWIVAHCLAIITALLLTLAFAMYMDRKVWAAVQLRRGPNVVGPWGLFQSFADLLKYVFKEPILPAGASIGIYFLAPFITFLLAIAAWAVVPVNLGWAVADINAGVLYLFAVS